MNVEYLDPSNNDTFYDANLLPDIFEKYLNNNFPRLIILKHKNVNEKNTNKYINNKNVNEKNVNEIRAIKINKSRYLYDYRFNTRI